MRGFLGVLLLTGRLTAGPIPEFLKADLTLQASFDKGFEADSARGDRAIYSAPGYKEQHLAKRGPGEVDAVIEKEAGVAGSNAIRFRSKNTRALFFRGQQNVELAGGTISFWLKLDPQKDLAPGFCDPIQITDKAYNDSAIWVDFTKDEVPRHFRLGVFGSLKAWNPTDTPPDKNPDFLRRLVVVERPPFAGDRWTHVAVTWSNLGVSGAPASAALYLNGKLISVTPVIREAFVWDHARSAIRLGVNYVGLMDEIMIFRRALSERDIATINRGGTQARQ
jgi:hypothetical protein